MKKKLISILICLCFVLLTAVNVNAQLPGIINFQAKIADNNGIPLNGLHTFDFLIIDQNSNILWDAYNIQRMIENGLYSVKLGDVSLCMDPISSSIFDDNDETYLRIFVDGEQLSDQQILPTCYAFKSEKSDDTHKIAGKPVSVTIPDNNEVLKWNGSEWEPGTDEVGGLTLPYYANYSGNNDAFEIRANGSGGRVATFRIENSSNGSDVLFAQTEGLGEAGYFRINNTNSSANAIYTRTNGDGYALYAKTTGISNCAYFRIDNTSNNEDVVKAITNGTGYAGYFEVDNASNTHYALWVETNATSGKAGKFVGNVYVTGDLDVGGSKDFLIDHPLDPVNKILRHSCIESSERINIYKGRAKLGKGEIKIQLPDYFDALNHPKGREIFLTSVNGWSPLFLSGKIKNNQFIVKTTKDGNPEQEFSWVIYAVRNDEYAKEHPLIVEQEKGIQNGFKKGELLYHKK